MNKSRARRWYEMMWLQGALLAVGVLVWWWLQRRGSRAAPERPVVWRRDIEMGPTTSGQQPEIVVSGESYPATFPDVEAGDGGPVELREREEGTSRVEAAPEIPDMEVPVEGPTPEAEGQGLETPGGDDLEMLEGIGPKINTILQEAGIRTFSQLAQTNVQTLEQILRGAGLRIANPGTWPEQARLAAEGDWSKLEALQATLKAGRRG